MQFCAHYRQDSPPGQTTYRKEWVDESRLREIPVDDSYLDPITRNVGDHVDLYFAEGWWEGLIIKVADDGLSIYLPGTDDTHKQVSLHDIRGFKVRSSGYFWVSDNWQVVPRHRDQSIDALVGEEE